MRGEYFMQSQTGSYQLTLPSDLSMLTVARTFVDSVGKACRLERSILHAIVLATGEAVSNILRHAHRDRPQAQFEIHLEVASDVIILSFLDEGDPFDLTRVPELKPGELRIGGRGIFLMRALMDELECQSRHKRGNLLRMVKRLDTLPIRDCG